MIGRAMEKWPSDALRRVLDAPVERWATNVSDTVMADGWWQIGRLPERTIYGNRWGACLFGHACNENESWHKAFERLTGSDDWDREDSAVGHFDKLCARFGIPRVVRAIKLRALRTLSQRGEVERTEPARVQVSA